LIFMERIEEWRETSRRTVKARPLLLPLFGIESVVLPS